MKIQHAKIYGCIWPVHRGKLIDVNDYIKKKNLKSIIIHLNKLEKWVQIKSKAKRKKEIIRTRVEINKIENRKTIFKKSRKANIGSFKKSTKLINL